ncbi:MAG: carboxypeptidase regulatory-like domain-containing protein [Candidatus Nanohaloarchaea archaeon]
MPACRKSYVVLAVMLLFSFVAAGQLFSSEESVTVDDGKQATRNASHLPEIAFLGSNLELQNSNGNPGHVLNLTNVSGVANSSGEHLSTSNVSRLKGEGRYIVRNETDTLENYTVDLVSDSSDIIGRIKSGEDLTTTDLELRYWLNNSRINTSGSLIDTKGPAKWQAGEYIYRVNTTSTGKLWIGVNSSKGGDFYAASAGKKEPRITDFPVIQLSGNVSGRIVNETGSGVADVKVRITGMTSSPLMVKRLPYVQRPPIRTDMTDSKGHFNFTGLQSGLGYSVEVTNSTYRRTNSTPFGADVSLSPDAAVDAGEFEVSSALGGINATVDAPPADGVRYGMIAGNRETGKGYMEPVSAAKGTQDVFFGNIPNGSYTVLMFRIDTRGGLLSTSFDSITRSNVTVEKDKNTTLSFAFEEKVLFTGKVTNSSNDPVTGVRVSAENRAEAQYVSDSTNATGHYTLRVVNNTDYTLEVTPPFDSDLTGSSTTVHVDAAKTGHDFVLSNGVVLNGTVEDQGGNPVEDAFITVYNETKDIHKFASADNGSFRVEGLESGVGYSVDIDAYSGGENHTTIDAVSGPFKTRNFTVTVQKATLSGKVTDTNNNGKGAKVVVEKDDGSRVTDITDSNGDYQFTGLRQGQFLEITVKPNSSSYREKNDYTYLTGDESINFELSVPAYLEGKVTDSKGDALGGVYVYAYNYSMGSYGWVETSSDGSYNITGLSPGPHDVRYYRDGYRRERKKVTVTKKDYQVSLSDGQSMSGMVLANGQDKDLDGYISFWNSEKGSYAYSEVNSGDYSVSGLKDVNHTVWVSIDGDSYAPKQLTINKPSDLGNSRNFSINTNQGKKLKVTVRNSSGMVVPAARVSTDYSEKETGSNGVAKFPKQPIGELTVSANKEGYRGAVDEINISGPTSRLTGGGLDKVREKNLTISRINEKKLVVNVTKSTRSGKAVSGATVFFVSNETGVSKSGSAVTDSNGKATVEHLAMGSFSVSLGLSEDKVYSNTTTIDSGETQFLSFNGSNYHLGYEVKPQ